MPLLNTESAQRGLIDQAVLSRHALCDGLYSTVQRLPMAMKSLHPFPLVLYPA